MPSVIIDGVQYVPKSEIPDITDEALKNCLMVLTEMRYFNEQHKMKRLAWNAIHALSPELAELNEDDAYNRVREVAE